MRAVPVKKATKQGPKTQPQTLHDLAVDLRDLKLTGQFAIIRIFRANGYYGVELAAQVRTRGDYIAQHQDLLGTPSQPA